MIKCVKVCAGLVVGLVVLIVEIKFNQKVPTTATKQILKAKAKINDAKRAIK